MALTTNTAVDTKPGRAFTGRVAAGTGVEIFQGERLAMNTTTGRAVVATAATGRTFLGIAENHVTGNTAGTTYVRFFYGVISKLPVVASQITELSLRVGQNAYMGGADSVTTATDAGSAGVRVSLGQIHEVDTTNSEAWVWLRVHAA